MEVRYRAPAKINWTLAVKRRRADGYHEIDTVMQAVSLYDELIVVSRRKPICLILTDDGDVPLGGNNLIYRAWRLLRERYPRRVGGIAVDLDKAIPMGAGLGGGSADAAATLAAAGKLFGLGLDKARLEALAAELGSDVPFFIRGGAARARGRGEKIERIASRLPPTHLVIVRPGFASPTAEAYGALKPEDYTKRSTAAAAAIRALTAGKRKALGEAMKNTFDAALRRIEPRYEAVFEAMAAAGLNGAMLAGSGSAVFAMARNRAQAMKAASALQAEYPETHAVRTIRGGVVRTD